MPEPLPIDHIVLAGPDLAAAVAWFTERTGVAPAPGGRHEGWGTANFLVGLSGGAYLEIIGPDPERPNPGRPRPFRVDEVSTPRLVTWAVRAEPSGSIDSIVAAARAAGYDPGDPAAMSRAAPGGQTLRWRLTPPDGGPERADGLVPFVVDWGDTTHPSRRDLPMAKLLALAAVHPEPATVRPPLTALHADLRVDAGPAAALLATVDGRSGPIEL